MPLSDNTWLSSLEPGILSLKDASSVKVKGFIPRAFTEHQENKIFLSRIIMLSRDALYRALKQKDMKQLDISIPRWPEHS